MQTTHPMILLVNKPHEQQKLIYILHFYDNVKQLLLQILSRDSGKGVVLHDIKSLRNHPAYDVRIHQNPGVSAETKYPDFQKF